MKWLSLFVLLLFSNRTGYGQNIISNGSFEQYSSCPNTVAQIVRATGWEQYSASPDYFNSCATGNTTIGVPFNHWGHQFAAHGNAYAGLITYTQSTITYKEYLAATFPPMTPGIRYEVSMFVSLADSSSLATNDLGAFFCTTPIMPVFNFGVMPYAPQINYATQGPVISKTTWTRLTTKFVPDSAYTRIVIGGFKSYQTVSTTPVSGGYPYAYTYYYFDSIVVKPTASMGIVFLDSLICSGDTFSVNYSTDTLSFNSNNTFTLQLSGPNGSFSNPVTINSITSYTSGVISGVVPASVAPGTGYRLRIVSSSPVDSSIDNRKDIIVGIVRPDKPVATVNPHVCTNETLILNATSSSAVANWSWTGPNGFKTSQQNPVIIYPDTNKKGSYIVTARNYGCLSKDTVNVIVNQAPQPVTASTKDTICTNDTLKLFTSPSETGVTYAWSGSGSFSSTAEDTAILFAQTTATGKYFVTATRNGCTEKDSTKVFVKPAPIVNAINNGPLCTGATLNLNIGSFTAGATYSWTGPGGYSSPFITPSRANVNTGMNGDYVITGLLNGCYAYDTTAVLIHPVTPKPTATNNSPVCAGGDIKLDASAIAGATYEWNGPGLYYSTAKNAIRANAALVDGGIYTVTAKLNNCISEPANTTVAVQKGPEILLYANPGDTLCPGWTVSLAAVPKNAGTSQSYEWFKNGNSTGITNISYNAGVPNSGDSFYVRMTAGSVCNTPINSKPLGITVLPVHTPPTINITASPGSNVWPYVQVVFKASTGNSGVHPGYQWIRNGVDISKALDSTWSATDLKTGDTICCRVSSNFLCAVPREVISNCIIMNVDLGVDEQKNKNGLHLYPNPNDGSFTIASREAGVLYVSGIQGNIISEHIILKGENRIQFPATVANGIYIGKFMAEDGKLSIVKILVRK